MQLRSRLILVAAAAVAAVGTVVVAPTAAFADTCGGYYFKYFATSGNISPWCSNENSWGVNAPNRSWWSGSLSPFFDHGIANGWYRSNDYLTSIQAGWEFGQGSYTASSWGVSGF